MSTTYYKRYRMVADLQGRYFDTVLPYADYRLVPWNRSLLFAHASTKYESFRSEMDAGIFPCLGELEGCTRLMEEIASKDGFLPEATWLIQYIGPHGKHREYCGTIQGIQANRRYGAIQNIGITPWHRGRGLGTYLLNIALAGFQQVGLRRASLQVTALNEDAIRLYQRYGFRKVKTLYKSADAVEV